MSSMDMNQHQIGHPMLGTADSLMAVDSTLQDCFVDLRDFSHDRYGADAISQLSQEWLFGIQNLDFNLGDI